MKKIYVMVAFLGATSFAFNQAIQKAPAHLTKNTAKAISADNGALKAPGASLWTDDFSDETVWTLGGDGVQGEWVIGDESDFNSFQFQGQTADLSMFMDVGGMTTAANGYAFFDGIQFNEENLAQNAWVQMASGIDCTGEDVVTLKFEQEYRAFATDITYAEVSIDGGATWEQATDANPDLTANTGAEETVKYINFDVDGSDDVRFRFRWQADAGGQGGGYGWQVDDVEVSTLADHDIAVQNQVFGVNNEGTVIAYYQTPLAQAAPIMGSTMLKNQGSQDQTNVIFAANETSQGAYSSSYTAANLLASESDSAILIDNFTPSAVGDYSIEYSLEYDNTDDVPSNNTFKTYNFTVGEHVYARDTSSKAMAGTVYGSLSGANIDPPVGITAGNVFDIFATEEVAAIQFQFGQTAPEGAEVFGKILDAELNEVPNGATEDYIIQPGDAGKYITLLFENPLELTPGEYVVAVESFEPDFSVAAAGLSPAQTSFVQYADEPDTWYYTTSTPVIRMSFDISLSVENNELSNLNVTQNFPNPFANETTVQFSLKEAANVSYTVVDLTGKVVANVNEGTTMAGDHEITIDGTSFANGVYYLNMQAGESTVTRKMIVNK